VIRRRYARGIENFHRVYAPLADRWRVYDNAGDAPRLVATGERSKVRVVNTDTWTRMQA
jgi:predicted ABC-type ATPase